MSGEKKTPDHRDESNGRAKGCVAATLCILLMLYFPLKCGVHTLLIPDESRFYYHYGLEQNDSLNVLSADSTQLGQVWLYHVEMDNAMFDSLKERWFLVKAQESSREGALHSFRTALQEDAELVMKDPERLIFYRQDLRRYDTRFATPPSIDVMAAQGDYWITYRDGGSWITD